MFKSKKLLLVFTIAITICSLFSCSRGEKINKLENGAEQFEDSMKGAVKTAVSSISDVSVKDLIGNIKNALDEDEGDDVSVVDDKIDTKEEESTPENDFAYLVGFMTADNLKKQYTNIFNDDDLTQKALENLKRGVDDLKNGIEISEGESKEIQNNFQKRINEINEVKARENLLKAEEWLFTNKQREEVVETPSGLQYEIIRQGGGSLAGKNAEVVVDYTMAAWDEDNIVDRGNDAHFSTQRLIDGANEGIALMNVGSIFKFYIHPSLGYGASDVGDIAPNSPLIFTVTLKEIT